MKNTENDSKNFNILECIIENIEKSELNAIEREKSGESGGKDDEIDLFFTIEGKQESQTLYMVVDKKSHELKFLMLNGHKLYIFRVKEEDKDTVEKLNEIWGIYKNYHNLNLKLLFAK